MPSLASSEPKRLVMPARRNTGVGEGSAGIDRFSCRTTARRGSFVPTAPAFAPAGRRRQAGSVTAIVANNAGT